MTGTARNERDRVMELFESTRGKWLAEARATAVRLARRRKSRSVTADDIWERCPPPVGFDPRVMGAVFNDRNTWRPGEWVSSRRKICHGRPIRVFTLI